MTRHRVARRVVLGSLVFVAGAAVVVAVDPAVRRLGRSRAAGGFATTTDSAIPPGAPIGGAFTLVDQSGKIATEASFRGRWMLVYFGYSRCPDECPLTLEKMAVLLNALGPRAARLAPVFITVDPAHDTPAVLARYLAKFSDRITGLTGTVAQIAAVAREYDAYFNTADHEASGRSLAAHSTFLYLMGPDGRFLNLFPVTITVAQLRGVINQAMEQ